jgi:cobalt-zinc-cadmium efflux system protein
MPHDHDHHDHPHGHDHDHGGHSHDHGHHGHSHAPADFGAAFAIGITLNSGFVIIEVVYGLLSHSMALVADAGHNLSDVLGLVMAWVAAILVKRAPTRLHTYGLRRSSILAALFNAIFLLVSIGGIAWESIRRFFAPEAISAWTVVWVSLIGIAINGITALLFMSGRKNDLNIRGAFLHMLADAAVSAGVVLAGFAILATGWSWIDPVVSLAIVAVILVGTWGLLRDSVNLALDAVPEGIDTAAIEQYLKGLHGVTDVHHLHVWGLSTTESALTVHLVLTEARLNDEFLKEINHTLHEDFRIAHTTIQFEAHGGECADCPPEG